ncbi:hypothetical protein M501DRAFT_1014911 [Patellaria atrata CBS 101060]|uniref:Uncharacterized protein n=1 Tax=Patellaria atrata CBS 101060 TaxID=1346257 RepID=A0A9P4SG06_9PEZI|nr:hypothetical protein M501DRAFT_1014911 [Patellaria atrata CBS 101060]
MGSCCRRSSPEPETKKAKLIETATPAELKEERLNIQGHRRKWKKSDNQWNRDNPLSNIPNTHPTFEPNIERKESSGFRSIRRMIPNYHLDRETQLDHNMTGHLDLLYHVTEPDRPTAEDMCHNNAQNPQVSTPNIRPELRRKPVPEPAVTAREDMYPNNVSIQ